MHHSLTKAHWNFKYLTRSNGNEKRKSSSPTIQPSVTMMEIFLNLLRDDICCCGADELQCTFIRKTLQCGKEKIGLKHEVYMMLCFVKKKNSHRGFLF